MDVIKDAVDWEDGCVADQCYVDEEKDVIKADKHSFWRDGEIKLEQSSICEGDSLVKVINYISAI